MPLLAEESGDIHQTISVTQIFTASRCPLCDTMTQRVLCANSSHSYSEKYARLNGG